MELETTIGPSGLGSVVGLTRYHLRESQQHIIDDRAQHRFFGLLDIFDHAFDVGDRAVAVPGSSLAAATRTPFACLRQRTHLAERLVDRRDGLHLGKLVLQPDIELVIGQLVQAAGCGQLVDQTVEIREVIVAPDGSELGGDQRLQPIPVLIELTGHDPHGRLVKVPRFNRDLQRRCGLEQPNMLVGVIELIDETLPPVFLGQLR